MEHLGTDLGRKIVEEYKINNMVSIVKVSTAKTVIHILPLSSVLQ